MGQLLQMLMLATVVEGRLMGVNPYGPSTGDAFKRPPTAPAGLVTEKTPG